MGDPLRWAISARNNCAPAGSVLIASALMGSTRTASCSGNLTVPEEAHLSADGGEPAHGRLHGQGCQSHWKRQAQTWLFPILGAQKAAGHPFRQEQQILAIARADGEPQNVLLDEPSLGLAQSL
jgi:ABC-type branched-subunit amino acid transport system ATPase component